MISVIIADDHKLFQQSISKLLNRYRSIEVVGEFDAGDQVIDYLKKSAVLPNILISDVRMPVMDGIELVAFVRKEYPSIRCIMLSMFDSVQNIREAMDKGASAYLDKSVSPDILVEAIQEVHKNGTYQTPKVQNAYAAGLRQRYHISEHYEPEKELNDIERQVVMLICEEYTNSQIADALKKSVRTIEGIRQGIMEKSGAKNVAGVVKYAIRNGIYNAHNE